MVVGTPPEPNVSFFEKATLDQVESKKVGRRIYRRKVYIKKRVAGATDWVAYRAKAKDIKQYPEEYALFERTQQGSRIASVDIIPSLDIVHLQELFDLGLSTIPALAAAETVPQHLRYAHRAAIAINNVLMEDYHAEEKGIEESNGETRGELLDEDAIGEIYSALEGHEDGGRLDNGSVGQSGAAGSEADGRDGPEAGLPEDRRQHDCQGIGKKYH